MKVIIIEDEYTARENLKVMLASIDPDISIIAELESIKETVNCFNNSTLIADLIFLDIELADGNSFQIFEQVSISIPIIFTTAYSQFAIKAFEVNSIDYLLKPITTEGLQRAISKFKNTRKQPIANQRLIQQFMQSMAAQQKKNYKQSFLIEQGDTLIPVKTNDFAYFFIENGIVKGITRDNKIYFLNEKLENLAEQLHPNQFFRANRQYLINREAIVKISIYFKGKLVVHIQPTSKEKILISKAKATTFKNWMSSSENSTSL